MREEGLDGAEGQNRTADTVIFSLLETDAPRGVLSLSASVFPPSRPIVAVRSHPFRRPCQTVPNGFHSVASAWR
jgi:hypothetical protein